MSMRRDLSRDYQQQFKNKCSTESNTNRNNLLVCAVQSTFCDLNYQGCVGESKSLEISGIL